MNNPLYIIVGAIVLWLYVAGPAKVGTALGEAYHNFITAAQGNK
jgi:hypothetical protein